MQCVRVTGATALFVFFAMLDPAYAQADRKSEQGARPGRQEGQQAERGSPPAQAQRPERQPQQQPQRNAPQPQQRAQQPQPQQQPQRNAPQPQQRAQQPQPQQQQPQRSAPQPQQRAQQPQPQQQQPQRSAPQQRAQQPQPQRNAPQPQQRAQQPPMQQRNGPQQPQPERRAQQPPPQRMPQPQPQRTQQQAVAWQQQRGWLQHGSSQPRTTWQQGSSQRWATDHRDWGQRGGYGGYYIPQAGFSLSFGMQHQFRMRTRPVMYMGYPRFEYGGYSFLLLDPWPDYWADQWYNSDDLYIEYDNGYYLYDRRYPSMGLAITVLM